MGEPESNRYPARPDLAPDALTLVSAIDRSEAVPLVGHLGEGPTNESVRLYESAALNRWLEIPTDAVVYRAAGSQSTVWVRRDASLAMCETVRASDYESPLDPSDPNPIKWPRP
jgi:hypothetical protein